MLAWVFKAFNGEKPEARAAASLSPAERISNCTAKSYPLAAALCRSPVAKVRRKLRKAGSQTPSRKKPTAIATNNELFCAKNVESADEKLEKEAEDAAEEEEGRFWAFKREHEAEEVSGKRTAEAEFGESLLISAAADAVADLRKLTLPSDKACEAEPLDNPFELKGTARESSEVECRNDEVVDEEREDEEEEASIVAG